LARAAGPLQVLIDSSGFKVVGEGEWKVRIHGKGKRRKWLKLHLSVDGNTGEVVAALTTVATSGDAPQVRDLLNQIEEPIAQVSADGAYDAAHVYRDVRLRGAQAAIPPRKGARIWFDRRSPGNKEVRHDRDQNLRAIRKKGVESHGSDILTKIRELGLDK
jgi:transposase